MKNANTKYFDVTSNRMLSDIWTILESGQWKKVCVNNFIFNNKIGELKRNEWKPVINGIHTIFPGMKWDNTLNKTQDPYYYPKSGIYNWDTFLNATKDVFQKYEDKRIGVQISGGLDSSIIICLLDYLKIPFYTVGLSTQRFEFRTEKYIQDLLRPLSINSTILDFENLLPLSNLNSVPAHQMPDINSLNFSADFAMAEEARKMGVDILFTGDGGDNLFSERISKEHKQCTWLPQNFTSAWIAENVYQTKGIELVSFYSNPSIMDNIFNLRKGASEDNSKLWARSFFKDILPVELSSYQYRADFWGVYISGFCRAQSDIKTLIDQAFNLTRLNHFSEEYYLSLCSKDYLQTNKELYQEIESIIAVSVWINGLKKGGFI